MEEPMSTLRQCQHHPPSSIYSIAIACSSEWDNIQLVAASTLWTLHACIEFNHCILWKDISSICTRLFCTFELEHPYTRFALGWDGYHLVTVKMLLLLNCLDQAAFLLFAMMLHCRLVANILIANFVSSPTSWYFAFSPLHIFHSLIVTIIIIVQSGIIFTDINNYMSEVITGQLWNIKFRCININH